MQEDFHYYATYCAAYLAGYTHEESLEICFSAQFVDLCTKTFLNVVNGPKEAATTQLNLELMDMKLDKLGLQEITSVWSSFHFLPADLNVKLPKRTKAYMRKYRLICGPNGELLKDTVNRAMGQPLEAVGIAMHILADTWAHRYFAGTPSLVINNTNYYFYEILEKDGKEERRPLTFKHKASMTDDIENAVYLNCLYQYSEKSIMNLGHGRAGHLPDYSFIKYVYLPAWMDYEEVIKDNPSDYYHAFCQMVYAMRTIHREEQEFEVNTYDFDVVAEFKEEIMRILKTRRLSASEDWKAFGQKLSGKEVPEFDLSAAKEEYMNASDKENTRLGRFFHAAVEQKRLVTRKIYAKPEKIRRKVKKEE